MKKLQNKKGFTLVEMIVVLAIIAILIALLAPNVARLIKNAQTTSDNAKAKTVMNTAQAYATDAVANGDNIIAANVNALGTDAYYVTLSEGTDAEVIEAFYDTGATEPSFMDASGDAYLPSNTVKGSDEVCIYFSLEGAVMGTVYYDATSTKIKAVSGVAPDGAYSGSEDFTTGNFRGGTYSAGTVTP